MSAAHTPTPGPWEFVPKLTASENHRGFFIRAEKPKGDGKFSLADVWPLDEDGKVGEANARLIAAAPQLLEALRRALQCLDMAAIPMARAAIKEGRAAIAAATGEQR